MARTIALSAIGVLAPMLYPLLTNRVFTKDDLAALHLPYRFLYQASLSRGEFLQWTPAYHAGFFLHGAGETAMTHPLHVALYALLPLGVAFNLEIIASYLFLFFGTFALLSRLGVARDGALFGAMTFGFCSFGLYNLMHVNHIATIAHAPWLMMAVHWLITAENRSRRLQAAGATALIFASQLMSGNPQYVWMTMVVLGYMLMCLWRAGHRRVMLFPVAGALALGVLTSSIQLLPTVAFFRKSTRAV
jgi:hypothetical protein